MTRVVVCLLTAVLAAGCGIPAGSGSVPLASDRPAAASPADATRAAGRTPSGAPASASARAAFLSHVFTDVRDGKQFTLGDFQGKQVLVLGMAVW